MKKTIVRLICVLLLAALFACALISCGDKNKGQETSSTTAKEESTTNKPLKPHTGTEENTTKEPTTTPSETTTKEPKPQGPIANGETNTDPYNAAVDMH